MYRIYFMKRKFSKRDCGHINLLQAGTSYLFQPYNTRSKWTMKVGELSYILTKWCYLNVAGAAYKNVYFNYQKFIRKSRNTFAVIAFYFKSNPVAAVHILESGWTGRARGGPGAARARTQFDCNAPHIEGQSNSSLSRLDSNYI